MKCKPTSSPRGQLLSPKQVLGEVWDDGRFNPNGVFWQPPAGSTIESWLTGGESRLPPDYRLCYLDGDYHVGGIARTLAGIVQLLAAAKKQHRYELALLQEHAFGYAMRRGFAEDLDADEVAGPVSAAELGIWQSSRPARRPNAGWCVVSVHPITGILLFWRQDGRCWEVSCNWTNTINDLDEKEITWYKTGAQAQAAIDRRLVSQVATPN